MSSSNKPKNSSQKQVINDYLEGLLQEVDDAEVALPYASDDVPKLKSKTIGLEALIAEIPDIIIQTEIESPVVQKDVIERIEKAKPLAEPLVTDEKRSETYQQKNTAIQISSVDNAPEWAQQSFQCLLFKVSGLTLAVPLTKLSGVLTWPEKITETPNQTDWFLGLLPNQNINVKIIDTALLVVPENRRQETKKSLIERFSHIILVDEGRWGLSCDTIGDVIWLDKEKVKWRKNKQQRPWLEGTALEYLCALLNTDAFAEMLNEKASA